MSQPQTIKENNGLIESIDKRLLELESEKNEIEKKYGISESILNSFSFSDKIPLPQNLALPKKKTQKIDYEKLQKINDDIPQKEITLKYKTPDNLLDSLKYEPKINDLVDKNNFEPTFVNLENLKSKPSLAKDYNVCNYVENCFNEDINQLYSK